MRVDITKTGWISDSAATDFPYWHWNIGALPFTRNCLAFACDAKEPDTSHLAPGQYDILIPSPGEMGGHPFNPKFTGKSRYAREMAAIEMMRKSLEADGFIMLPYENQKDIPRAEGYYLTAVYLEELLEDYHFCRRHEKTGVWYHKRGLKNFVTDRDRPGNRIIDPKTANRGWFPHFVCFAFVPNTGIKLDIQIRPAQEEHGYRYSSPAAAGFFPKRFLFPSNRAS